MRGVGFQLLDLLLDREAPKKVGDPDVWHVRAKSLELVTDLHSDKSVIFELERRCGYTAGSTHSQQPQLEQFT